MIGRQSLQFSQQGELALSKALAAQRFPVCWVNLLVEFERIDFRKTVQAALLHEMRQGRALHAFLHPKAQTDQTPSRLAPAPGHGAHGVDRLLVRRARLVPVRDAQKAPGAVTNIQAFGHRAQVGKVVGPQAAHETVIQPSAGSSGGRRVGHDEAPVGRRHAAGKVCFRVRQDTPGGSGEMGAGRAYKSRWRGYKPIGSAMIWLGPYRARLRQRAASACRG